MLSKKTVVLLLLISFLNFWVWEMLKANILLTVFLLVITLSLYYLIDPPKILQPKGIFLVLVSVYVTASSILIINNFDKTLIEMNPIEINTHNRHHEYLAAGLGYIFTNKVSMEYYSRLKYPLSGYLRNISYCNDINLYFLKSHPREKTGIDEVEKYSLLMIPFFILGLITHALSPERYKLLSIYLLLTILITGFISLSFKLGPVLMFPYINVIILLGMIKSAELIKHTKYLHEN